MTSLLGTSAPLFSDVAAFAEIALAVVLVVGMFMVRRGRIRLHMYLQSSAVLVNLPIVLTWMVPRYLAYVLPVIPGDLTNPFYLLPTVMLIAGAVAEGLGIYIILVAGTRWIPERFRFRRYKLWMRLELSLWWSIVVLGLSTYLVWYGGY